MEIIDLLARQYAEKYSTPEAELLREVAADTQQKHPKAHMLSGHLQGKFLELISRIARPHKILEIGTFTGYSALCLAKGLQPGGELHTIELREEEAAIARENFNKSDASDNIILHVGNALDIIPSLTHEWDIVFIDADKINYIAYYEAVIEKVRKGGIILADNVLFHGQVLQEQGQSKSAKAIQAFNERVQKDETVEKVMLTIRDGLLLILKK